MENISYIGLSQQMSLHQQMNIAANNLANMNTPGFKAQGALFIEYLNKAEGAPQEVLRQAINHGSYRDLGQGSLQQTFNDYDFAIQGDGYFAIATEGGERYTRAGSFSLNANRELVTKDGELVQGEGGGALTIPAEATDISLGSDGVITTNVGDVGRLKIVNFDNPQALVEQGGNLYSAEGAAPLPSNAKVVQGAVEASNVNPVIEMNRMIEVLRLYQGTQKMLMNDHDRIRSTIQKLTKV